MQPLELGTLADVLGATSPRRGGGPVRRVIVDSRRCGPGDLFVALPGQHTDGHRFVQAALDAGAVAAIVQADYAGTGRSLLRVADPLSALQQLAAWVRRTSLRTVVAITGSNGKTIVKDALLRLMAGQRVYGNPGSHNSQLGVPLAVLGAPAGVDVAIFEAGASAPGEMARLAQILQPDHGAITNIGLAHIAGFGDRAITAREKLGLFKESRGWLVLPPDEPLLEPYLAGLSVRVVRRGRAPLPILVGQRDDGEGARLVVRFDNGDEHAVRIGTRSQPLIEDLMVAAGMAWQLGVPADAIMAGMEGFSPGPTRMEVWRAPEGVTLINDAYSADPMSVQAALRSATVGASAGGRRIFVFGGMRELGGREAAEHALVGEIARNQGFDRLVLLQQPALAHTATAFGEDRVTWVPSADAVREVIRSLASPGDVILIKGPRRDGLQDAARALWESMAPKRLIVDLAAIRENIARFRRLVGADVRILAMLKAWAYGTELARVARDLQAAGVNWIGVSAADEGAMLRRAGVHLPILVTLLDRGEVDKVIRYRLTPAVYSHAIADALIAAADRSGAIIDVHLHVDTGMGRLGVQPEDIAALARVVRDARGLRATGLMTHFSSADDPGADPYSHAQQAAFDASIAAVEAEGLTDLLKHAAASSAAARFSSAHYDMIRVGLAMYGVPPSLAAAAALPLQPALALVGRITHVTTFRRGQKIGYSGTYIVAEDALRAGVVGMGYNDGVPWRLSNRGHAMIRGQRVRFLGRISMDSLVVDLSDHPDVGIGEDVLLFGSHDGAHLPIEEVAALAGTIPYEVMVKVDSRRVQRLFVGD
ncbi:MAG: alanine racemase [Myxococcota bacterium]